MKVTYTSKSFCTELIVKYINCFVKRSRLLYFFENQVVAYSAIMLVTCVLVLFQQRRIVDIDSQIQQFVTVTFVLANSVVLASFLRPFYFGPKNEYLLYLRFNKKQLGVLACLSVSPAIFFGAFFFFVVLTDGQIWELRFCLTLAATLVEVILSFVFLWLQKSWAGRKQLRKRKAIQNITILRAFRSPYSAFFRKDFHYLRRFDNVFSGIIMLLFGIGVMLLARVVPSLYIFAICLYCLLAVMIMILAGVLYEREIEAIVYYRHQLRLKNIQILIYRLPLPTLAITCYVFVLTAFAVWGHNLIAESLFVALGLMIYASATCASVSWWFIQRLQSEKGLDLLYIIPLFGLSAIPFAAMIYMLVSYQRKAKLLISAGDNQDA